jgi:hypothetical protein
MGFSAEKNVRKIGPRFDFMYSNNESGDRVPRGYAFVTYEDYVTASEAIARLNGFKLMNRELKVQTSSATHLPSKCSSSAFKCATRNPFYESVSALLLGATSCHLQTLYRHYIY